MDLESGIRQKNEAGESITVEKLQYNRKSHGGKIHAD